MTSQPQPLRSWRLLALVAGLAGGLALVERLAGLPSASWPSETAPRVSAAIAALPSDEVTSGHPVMSLVMDPADLHDPARGILANVLEHGRDWERPGTVAYFDDGQLKFATGVGVRIHGGGSRKTSARQGFRLYFRREYGARQVPPDVLFGPDAQPIRHLVVHNDVRDGRHFANPLAYDIAREVGAVTASTSPVRFFVNGEFYGVFVLTERFDAQYFQAHWGHDRLDWRDEDMQSFWEWSVQHRPMTMADVAARADVENLARWFLATAFTATRDAYQGPGQFLDSSRTPPRWFWVNWDMDGSFRAFDLDSYADLLNRVDELQRGRSHTEPRSNLLTTLFAEDEAFRTLYKRVFTAAMNHHLTPDFLARRLEYYRRAGEQLGVTNTKYVREYRTFLEKRPAFFRMLTESWLNTAGSQPMALAMPADESVTIDGEVARDGFEGWYFPDLEIELLANGGENFDRWEVNGAGRGGGKTLRLRVDRPTVVEAVFRGKPRSTPQVRPRSAEPAAAPVVSADRLTWASVSAPPGGVRFQLTTHEVTVAAFRSFSTASGRRMPTQPGWYSAPDHPVVNVTWDEAVTFCAAAGARLPTEDEFVHASALEPLGDGPPPWGDQQTREVNLLGLRGSDRFEHSGPVGSFARNRFGVFDMIGNVWEWTSTEHNRSTPQYELRVAAGGSWDTPARSFPRRAALSRHGRHNLYVGFRCAR
jgi:Sulfatase-modifying factor enzyme 1/CotH kinase protein